MLENTDSALTDDCDAETLAALAILLGFGNTPTAELRVFGIADAVAVDMRLRKTDSALPDAFDRGALATIPGARPVTTPGGGLTTPGGGLTSPG